MPGELPGHHGLLHSARPGEPPPLFHRASLKRDPPALCCCLPRICLLQRGVALAACSSLEAARSPAPSGSTFLPPPRLVQQQLPQEGGDGRVHARMERVGCWGMGQVMGTSLLPREDLNPCLCPERQPPLCPSVPCGCCHCSCSWGSAASGPGWSPQTSPSPHLDLDHGPSLCSQPSPDSQTTAGQPAMEGSITYWIISQPPNPTSASSALCIPSGSLCPPTPSKPSL